MKLLEGKRALILGVANERSIAWGIAQSYKEHGAQIALTYANDALKKRVEPLAEQLNAEFICPMDVTIDLHYAELKNKIKENWGHFDILVHSLAYANAEDLKKKFCDVSRQGFLQAIDISAYSLVGLCQYLSPLINQGGSVIALTYYGSQKVIDNYNVMGVAKAALESSARYLAQDLGVNNIRVNCISAGPIKTLAASGISGFRSILSKVEERAPLKRNVSIEDVGKVALFLASDLAKGVTGQIHFVDSGFSIMGI